MKIKTKNGFLLLLISIILFLPLLFTFNYPIKKNISVEIINTLNSDNGYGVYKLCNHSGDYLGWSDLVLYIKGRRRIKYNR